VVGFSAKNPPSGLLVGTPPPPVPTSSTDNGTSLPRLRDDPILNRMKLNNYKMMRASDRPPEHKHIFLWIPRFTSFGANRGRRSTGAGNRAPIGRWGRVAEAANAPRPWQPSAVTGQLRLAGGDDGDAARCVGCGAQAVGPCARCHSPVCGDCCVLTDGSAKTWAICLDCDRRSGRSLGRGWLQVIAWVAGPIVVLAALVLLLELLAGSW